MANQRVHGACPTACVILLHLYDTLYSFQHSDTASSSLGHISFVRWRSSERKEKITPTWSSSGESLRCFFDARSHRRCVLLISALVFRLFSADYCARSKRSHWNGAGVHRLVRLKKIFSLQLPGAPLHSGSVLYALTCVYRSDAILLAEHSPAVILYSCWRTTVGRQLK